MKYFILTLLISFYSYFVIAQDELNKYNVACIAFYNLENIFDTLNDPNFNDDDFTPEGVYLWNSEKYLKKVKQMSEVISKIGDELTSGGPVFIGVCEVENEAVLKDIVNSEALIKSNYGIVHYDCQYARGVDVGFLYRKDYFNVSSSKTFQLLLPTDPDYKTRDILLVTGELEDEKMHILVNHWPSRRGGEKRSEPNRIVAAQLCKSIIDSINKCDTDAKIFIMGDFNDDPTNASINKILGAKYVEGKVEKNGLFNPHYKLFKNGIGSLAYRDSWNLFDQILISEPLIREDKSSYRFYLAKIYNKKYLTQKEGQYAGYPLRTYVGETYVGGYSDHFPSYIFIVKNK